MDGEVKERVGLLLPTEETRGNDTQQPETPGECGFDFASVMSAVWQKTPTRPRPPRPGLAS